MAPPKSLQPQYIDSQALKVKNTFIHSDQADLDDSDWIIRRQASEPAPNRQLSGVRRQVLEKCEEADEGSNSESDLDMDVSHGLFRQGPTDIQQSIDFPDNFAMDRQTSVLSVLGFDKQVSVLSATGLCRQETEMQWPTYATSSFNADDATPSMQPMYVFNADDATPTANSSTSEVENAPDLPQRTVIGLEDLISAPSSSEGNVQMPPPINPMMWPMAWPGAFALDPPAVTKPSTGVPPFRSRNKATSLITQAQEQQAMQKRLLWSQSVQLLKQYSEQMPGQQQQQQQLNQNFKTWFGSVPELEQESMTAFVTSQQKRDLLPAMPAAKSDRRADQSSDEDATANQPKAMAQFCPYCGEKVQKRFKFCRYCGKDVSHLWDA